MLIVHRDPSLKNPRAMRREKQQLVLDWLLEFRFSSVDLLARRLGLTRQTSSRFFRGLRDTGLVQRFTHAYFNHEQYYMLTRAGVAYLDATGRETTHACTAPSRLIRYAPVRHDLAVQQAMLRRLPHYLEVIWDRHIRLPAPYDRPDLLMQNTARHWIAVEYERSRKADNRIYMSLRKHAQAIIERHYNAVYYLFPHDADRVHYQTLFEAPEWPEYKVNRHTGKIVPLLDTFTPDKIGNLRKCFRFTHEPAAPPAPERRG